MELFPAIDLIDGCAVAPGEGRLCTENDIQRESCGSSALLCGGRGEISPCGDLEGAKNGGTPNLETIRTIVRESGLLVEVGGGIRSEEVIKTYLDAGVFRVILGTAAVQNPAFLEEMVRKYGEKIAVGVDIKDGRVAIKGWTEVSEESCFAFCEKLQKIGVKTIICTDISKDGLLSGTNLELYRQLSEKCKVDIVASGGVTTLDDVKRLAEMKLYGAILGKALYTGNIDLAAAVTLTKEGNE